MERTPSAAGSGVAIGGHISSQQQARAKILEGPMNRRSILSVSAIAVLGLALLPSHGSAQDKSLKDQLVGAWTLDSIYNQRGDSPKMDPWGSGVKGSLMLSPNGRFSLFIVAANRNELGIEKSPHSGWPGARLLWDIYGRRGHQDGNLSYRGLHVSAMGRCRPKGNHRIHFADRPPACYLQGARSGTRIHCCSSNLEADFVTRGREMTRRCADQIQVHLALMRTTS